MALKPQETNVCKEARAIRFTGPTKGECSGEVFQIPENCLGLVLDNSDNGQNPYVKVEVSIPNKGTGVTTKKLWVPRDSFVSLVPKQK